MKTNLRLSMKFCRFFVVVVVVVVVVVNVGA